MINKTPYIHAYNRILFEKNNKTLKEWHIHPNANKPGKYHAKRKKSVAKEYILYDLNELKHSEEPSAWGQSAGSHSSLRL